MVCAYKETKFLRTMYVLKIGPYNEQMSHLVNRSVLQKLFKHNFQLLMLLKLGVGFKIYNFDTLNQKYYGSEKL